MRVAGAQHGGRRDGSVVNSITHVIILLGFVMVSAVVGANCENCTSAVASTINDGICDSLNNNQDCGYDGGDCCLCTCIYHSTCAFGALNCRDPDVGGDRCDWESPPLSRALTAVAPTSWVVESTAQVQALAGAVSNCSGGVFEVEWRGSVVVEEAIIVTNGCVLNITGVGMNAGMDGKVSPVTSVRKLTHPERYLCLGV